MSVDEHSGQVSENGGPAQRSQPATLLQARRKFLVGSVAITGCAATLASRPALAWQQGGGNANWVYADCQKVCSLHASNTKTGTVPSCYHLDYYCSNTSHWQSWSSQCKTIKFSDCGEWVPSTGVCGFSDEALWYYVNKCYQYYSSSGQKSRYESQSQSQSQGGNQNNNNNNNYFCYQQPDTNTCNAAWIACGFINAQCNPAFGITPSEFSHACGTAFSTPNCNGQVIASQICSSIYNSCTSGRIGNIVYQTYHSNWCWG